MNRVTAAGTQQRADLFTETASRLRLEPTIVEKDFWVCWALQQVFDSPERRAQLIFKGGTSLAKVFGVIERFSEDVDLSIRRDTLGFGGDREPELAPNATQQKKRLDALRSACQQAVRHDLLPALNLSFTEVLGEQKGANFWTLDIDPNDPYVLLFTYPPAITTAGEHAGAYIRPIVKLEMGVGSDPYPIGEHSVISYAAKEFPHAFSSPTCKVVALEAERTFWEKATLLHAEYHRPMEAPTPVRLSRHFSDLARLAASPAFQHALTDTALRRRVVEHKSVFFRSGWAQYDEARPGTFHLLPTRLRDNDLRRDYHNMREMFLQEPPSWDSVLEVIRELEQAINNLPD